MKLFSSLKTKEFRLGGYSVLTALFVLAIAFLVNIMISMVPKNYTQIDTTAQQIFALSDQSKNLISNLTEDITIYWVTREGMEDSYVEHLLDQYEAISDHIIVEKKDPELYPAFIEQYTYYVENDNEIIVVKGDDFVYIPWSKIYILDEMVYYYYGAESYDYAGESAITSAINTLVNGKFPVIYNLVGHGELTLNDNYMDKLESQNFKVVDFSIFATEAIPEDATAVMINCPTNDITPAEANILLDYLKSGGSLMLITNPHLGVEFPNLNSVTEYYGMSEYNGLVIEDNPQYYTGNTPFYLLPDIYPHEISSPLADKGYFALMAMAEGINIEVETRGSVFVSPILKTSPDSFVRMSNTLDSYVKMEGDIDGPICIAAAASETVSDNKVSQIVWYGSYSIEDISADTSVAGTNSDLFINSLGWLCSMDDSVISIHPKDLTTDVLLIDEKNATLLKVLFLAIIPLAYIGLGICIVVKRRGR